MGAEHCAVDADDEAVFVEDDEDNGRGVDAEDLRRRAANGEELAQWAVDMADGTEGEAGYPTPERAALAEWDDYPDAGARVISVEYRDENNAVVVTDTVPSHPMWNYRVRTPDGWVFTHDHN